MVRARHLVLLLALLASACGEDRIAQDATFGDGKANAEGSGLILVGLRVAREPITKTFLGDFAVHPSYDVSFIPIRPDGSAGRARWDTRICGSGRSLLNGVLSDCRPEQRRFSLLQVPAGRYSLSSISYSFNKTHVTTSFIAKPAGPRQLGPELPSAGDPVRAPGQSFTVASGEIAYIGNLDFFFDPASLGAKISFSRNDAAARRALMDYPNVRGDIRYEPIAGVATILSAVPLGPNELPPIVFDGMQGASQ